MLALFILPALLGLALFMDTSEVDEEPEEGALPSDPQEGSVSSDPEEGSASSDPEEETPQVATQQVVSDGFLGTDAAEKLRLDTEGGFVSGAGGADTISGSVQADGIVSGPGDDIIYARGGDDVVSGDAGNDRVFLGAGNDDYSADDETYANLAGDDFVRGGDGNDFIADLLGSNDLRGDLGRDTLVAVDALSAIGNYGTPSEFGTTDTLTGGYGADVLFGDAGDIMTGGNGQDAFFATDDEDTDLAEVRITDFDPLEDTLFVVQLDGLTTTSDLAYEAVTEGLRVSFEGRAVALLEGLDTAAIPDIQISLTDLAGFEDRIN